MIDKYDTLYQDLEAVKSISIVPTMLDVVCRITGMGFAAIARVTEDRWIACSVDDRVNFGLAEGGELEIKTTICNEIRDNHKEVVIDHVDADEHFRDHHTPKMYGLQSYISFPIILKNGEFFGTLCAIDSKPAQVNKPEILGTFKLFAELLAFHLQSQDLMDRSNAALRESNKTLHRTTTDNEVYKKISDHNIQEQVRKLSLFSDILLTTAAGDADKVRDTATKINATSRELSHMIEQVSRFTDMRPTEESFEPVDLNDAVKSACNELDDEMKTKNIPVEVAVLPLVAGIPWQLRELFLRLINHGMLFAAGQDDSTIHIYSRHPAAEDVRKLSQENPGQLYTEIVVEQKGSGTIDYNLQNVFDLFLHLSDKQSAMHYGSGLAYSRKIVYNHSGAITAKSIPDGGVSFHVILPIGNAEQTVK